MFACPDPDFTTKCAYTLFLRVWWAWIGTLKPGLKERLRHPATWNRLDTFAVAPSAEPMLPVTLIGSQLVGLSMTPHLSIVTLSVCRSTGMPFRIVGIEPLTTLTCEMWGSTLIFALTMAGCPPSGR